MLKCRLGASIDAGDVSGILYQGFSEDPKNKKKLFSVQVFLVLLIKSPSIFMAEQRRKGLNFCKNILVISSLFSWVESESSLLLPAEQVPLLLVCIGRKRQKMKNMSLGTEGKRALINLRNLYKVT